MLALFDRRPKPGEVIIDFPAKRAMFQLDVLVELLDADDRTRERGIAPSASEIACTRSAERPTGPESRNIAPRAP